MTGVGATETIGPGWGAENAVGVKPIIFPKRRWSEFSLF